jgi:hypothetical protein
MPTQMAPGRPTSAAATVPLIDTEAGAGVKRCASAKDIATDGLSHGGHAVGEQQNENGLFEHGTDIPFRKASPASRLWGKVVNPRWTGFTHTAGVQIHASRPHQCQPVPVRGVTRCAPLLLHAPMPPVTAQACTGQRHHAASEPLDYRIQCLHQPTSSRVSYPIVQSQFMLHLMN